MRTGRIKYGVLALWCALALAPAGCKEDVLQAEDGYGLDLGTEGRIAVTAQTDGGDVSRTALGGFETQWIAGDRIGVFSPQADARNVPYEAKTSAATSAFDGEMTWGEGSHDFYAFYPYAEGSFDHTAVPVSLPANQTQRAGGNSDHIGALDVMVASPLSGILPDGDVRFRFDHLFVLLEFRVLGTGKISKVEFSGGTAVILALDGGVLDISQATPAAGKPYMFKSAGSYSPAVSLTLGEPAALTRNEATTPALYMMLYPTTLVGRKIDVTVTVDGVPRTFKTNGFSLDRGNKYKLVVDTDAPEYYTSTDYSANGRVTRLQQARSDVKGIDVVLMGDAYSDRMIADGTYDRAMNFAMESFFAEEPYKSHREMFNVYSVVAVSANEEIASGTTTALGTHFGEGTAVGGSDNFCMGYARSAVETNDRLDKAVLIVMINDPSWHGTCWMYYPTDREYGEGNDHGEGLSISYFTIGRNDEEFKQLLQHEANGHGFPKLGDEYYYSGTISQADKDELSRLAPAGWWRNVDVTSDRERVKWAGFLNDSRYATQGLGVYLGGFTWQYGVWRSTEYSIMRYNTGGFNAPSREAIYYRINKLAHGLTWKYDRETFVAWDLSHRSAAGLSAKAAASVFAPVGHTPPVVVPMSWREAFGE